jgi:hypothetical protein
LKREPKPTTRKKKMRRRGGGEGLVGTRNKHKAVLNTLVSVYYLHFIDITLPASYLRNSL